MKALIYKYIFLVLTAALSAFTAGYPLEYVTWLSEVHMLITVQGPGVAFTGYLLILFRKELTIKRSIIYFLVLTFFYYIAFTCSCGTYGLVAPIAGGVGAYLIKKLFKLKIKSAFFSLVGFLVSFIGLFASWIIKGPDPTMINIVSIIVLWQLCIGHFIIRDQTILKSALIVKD